MAAPDPPDDPPDPISRPASPPRPASTAAAWRIVDANCNRAAEGLRTVEDYLRLALKDRHLAALCKGLRHELGAWAQRLPDSRLRARDTLGDVGTTIQTPQESHRSDLQQVLAAAFERSKQALRAIEEYSKVVSPASAPWLEQLRYRLYTLEQAAAVTRQARGRLAGIHLYLLADGAENAEQFAVRVRQVLSGGGDTIIQLRDKHLDDRRLLERARCLRRLTRELGGMMVVNDRPDIALLAAADGVHVGQQELTVADVRAVVGPDLLVGVSTHSLEQARRAVQDGADYLGLGPVFPSRTKAFDQLPGCQLLRQVAAEIQLPAFAIGGITLENLDEVLASGVDRVAVRHAVWQAADPAAAASRFRQRLRRPPTPG